MEQLIFNVIFRNVKWLIRKHVNELKPNEENKTKHVFNSDTKLPRGHNDINRTIIYKNPINLIHNSGNKDVAKQTVSFTLLRK